MIISSIKNQIAVFLENNYCISENIILKNIGIPPNENMGDIAIGLFEFMKTLKRNPKDVGDELGGIILDSFDYIEKFEVVGPYLNLFLNKGIVSEKILSYRFIYEQKSEKVNIEFLSANPNKPLHIGQARNIFIGDSLVRIFKKLGCITHANNYGDDSGVNVGLNILAHYKLGYPFDTEEKFDVYCGKIYTEMRQKEDNEEFKNYLSDILKQIEKGDNVELNNLHNEYTRKCTLGQFESCWKVNVFFDLVNWETDILHMKFFEHGMDLLKSKGYVKYMEYGPAKGCWIIDLSNLEEFSNEDKKYQILVKSDGVATYTGKDIVYAMWKLGYLGKDFFYNKLVDQPNGTEIFTTTSEDNSDGNYGFGNYDYSIAVIDLRQSFAQKVVKGALKLLGFLEEKNYYHIPYGVVFVAPDTLERFGYELDEEEKLKSKLPFSSRKGRFVTIDDTLELLFKKAVEETKQRNPDESEEWITHTSNKIAIAAFRFSLLSGDILKDLTFDINSALSMEGETGPYVLYTFARVSNIIKKSGVNDFSINRNVDYEYNKDEFMLLKKMDEFSEVLMRIETELTPNILTKYLFELCQLFNNVYSKNKFIVNDEIITRYRIRLLSKLKLVLKDAMNLIGIEEVEKM